MATSNFTSKHNQSKSRTQSLYSFDSGCVESLAKSIQDLKEACSSLQDVHSVVAENEAFRCKHKLIKEEIDTILSSIRMQDIDKSQIEALLLNLRSTMDHKDQCVTSYQISELDLSNCSVLSTPYVPNEHFQSSGMQNRDTSTERITSQEESGVNTEGHEQQMVAPKLKPISQSSYICHFNESQRGPVKKGYCSSAKIQRKEEHPRKRCNAHTYTRRTL